MISRRNSSAYNTNSVDGCERVKLKTDPQGSDGSGSQINSA